MAKARRRGKISISLLMFLALLGGGLYLASLIEMPRAELPAREGMKLGEAKAWGYQLQKVQAAKIPADHDVLVVDYSRDGSDGKAFTPQYIEKLRRRADGTRRIVLAYLSVGEAESYRYYWQKHWSVIAPSWLGDENSNWAGNFPVRFWQPAWQRIIMTPKRTVLDALLEQVLPWRKPYIDRIMEAGFDGVYLDRVDVFGEWGEENANADKDMVRFVALLSAYAKSRKLGFLVVPQNGEELLSDKNYRAVIDGLAKEDLYFGIDHDGTRNPEFEIKKSQRLLKTAKRDGLPIFVVEYLKRAEEQKRMEARQQAEEDGFVMTFAKRALDEPPERIAVRRGSPRAQRRAASTGQPLIGAPGNDLPTAVPVGSAGAPKAGAARPTEKQPEGVSQKAARQNPPASPPANPPASPSAVEQGSSATVIVPPIKRSLPKEFNLE